jgi:hypothetical protein
VEAIVVVEALAVEVAQAEAQVVAEVQVAEDKPEQLETN